MFTAIVWIGKYGSWSKGGFDTEVDAQIAALAQISTGAFGTRTDLVADAAGPK